MLSSESTATVTWKIPEGTEDGTYMIWNYGDYKHLTGGTVPFTGHSSKLAGPLCLSLSIRLSVCLCLLCLSVSVSFCKCVCLFMSLSALVCLCVGLADCVSILLSFRRPYGTVWQ